MYESTFVNWFLVTCFILFCLFMVVTSFYYRSMAQKEKKDSAHMKYTLVETEVLIQKHQLSLQRALGNIDILTKELNTLKGEVKTLKQRNSQYRIETDNYKSRIKDLEQKIEALL
ncbi:hypothetical protein DCO58_09605 [Helicobacter saguini]|uniref:Uncharacterized protein n=2 Tax=Helicobacter saguini TaxID=1548018 RepID=A0A347VPB9_9HELI|nr:hypothetical protein [Helicobacter saguini]MWV61428.1 hypothetical protein [Helicobacter saguini]MWV67902.1 hypothetical protein [Helicobacter saguini]MWV70630.1 hypothetical protein [Helicobacter saguini]MWV72534.1 hypothetical protein [Helicobacter saguini]TLD94727.1 hypothetical protein LS64_004185 [Helicobacter saguini]